MRSLTPEQQNAWDDLRDDNQNLRTRLAEAERERDNAWDRYAEVLAENRLLREALKDAIEMLPAPPPLSLEYDDYLDVVRNLESTPLTAAEVARVERLEQALESMCWQFAYRDGDVLGTYGLSALEDAFSALGWDDPHLAALEVKDEHE
jgi:hypothetical protein